MRRRGQAFVIVALSMVVLLGIAAVAVDYGQVAFARTKLQNAVDAAALAGAQLEAEGQNPTTNQAWLKQQNLGQAGTITVAESKSVPNGIRATATETVPAGFAAIFGVKSFVVQATAVAAAGGPFDYALFQGATGSPGLDINGSISIQGAAHSNGTMHINGGGCITGGVTTVGGATIHPGLSCGTSTLDSVIPMPIWTQKQVEPAGAPTETVSGTPTQTTFNGPLILNAQGNDLNFNGSATLNGPIVIVNAPSVTIDGGATLSGSLVVFGGNLTFNGSVSQTGPGPAGMAVAVIGSGDNVILDGSSSFQGIIYDPQGNIDFNGSVDVTGSIIGYHVDGLNGSSVINYDPSLLKFLPVTPGVQLVQ
jgi:phage baseplate assembly protein gpV